MNNFAGKIILGSAQFGLEYGISNTYGQLSETAVEEILLTAHHIGIRLIDTAPAYGCAQQRIANICKKNNITFAFISKIPPCNPSEVRAIALQTLEQLQTQSLDTLLLHDFRTYIQNPSLWEKLRELREKSLTRRIGFSLYCPHELEHILNNIPDCDVVQIPFNLLDMRFKPFFHHCRRNGIAIHARSVFLQGAFFLPPETLPTCLQPALPHIQTLHKFCQTHNISIAVLALSHVLYQDVIEAVIFGVHCAKQLYENCSFLFPHLLLSRFYEQLQQLPTLDETVINPSFWRV